MNYTSTITSKGTITLPVDFRKALNLKPGVQVTLSLEGSRILVDPPINVAEVRARNAEHVRKLGIPPPTKADIERLKLEEYIAELPDSL